MNGPLGTPGLTAKTVPVTVITMSPPRAAEGSARASKAARASFGMGMGLVGDSPSVHRGLAFDQSSPLYRVTWVTRHLGPASLGYREWK